MIKKRGRFLIAYNLKQRLKKIILYASLKAFYVCSLIERKEMHRLKKRGRFLKK